MDVILHLTQDCQLDCVYCYGGRKQARTMPWDVARRAIDLVFDDPPTDTTPLISFFGGEPLLEFPLLQQCVDYIKARSAETGQLCRTAITTNGLGLNDTIAHYIAANLVVPTLSFDGVREAQDACRLYRDGTSSFADTEKALHTLRRHFDDFAVCAVVTPSNVEYLPESVDFFLESGVSRLLLNPDFFAQWDDRGLDLWRQGYECVGDRFETEFRHGRIIHVNFITAKIVTHLKGGYDPCDCCDFGQKEIAVAPSGNIYPCQRMVGEDTRELGLMGSVFEGLNTKTCWDLANVREVTSPECLACDLRRRCRNWCSCVNHRLTGRFDLTSPLVCFHERMAIEIADRAASRLFRERNAEFMETFYFEKQVAPEWV